MVFDAVCKSTARLDNKTVVITGANTGIGKSTAQNLYKRGARVILACRNLQKAQQAATSIVQTCHGQNGLGKLVIIELDLANFESIGKCAKRLYESENQIHILINNAGVYCPESRTVDGYEMQFATNHLGHFMLTLMLLPRIIKSAPARIINVSSHLHYLNWGSLRFDDLNWEKRHYSPGLAYSQSKLANVFFTKELTRKLKEANIEGVTTYCLHPGGVASDFSRHVDSTWFYGASILLKFINPFLKTTDLGAQTTIYCAVEEKLATESGLYYAECARACAKPVSNNPVDGKRLWDMSYEMIRLPKDYNPFISV